MRTLITSLCFASFLVFDFPRISQAAEEDWKSSGFSTLHGSSKTPVHDEYWDAKAYPRFNMMLVGPVFSSMPSFVIGMSLVYTWQAKLSMGLIPFVVGLPFIYYKYLRSNSDPLFTRRQGRRAIVESLIVGTVATVCVFALARMRVL